MRTLKIAPLLAAVLAGCVDAEPLTPDFDQRIFSVLGGLEVGEALTLVGADAQSIVLAGGESGARYVFIPFLAAEQGSVRLRVEVSGNDLEPVPSSATQLYRAPSAVGDPRPATRPLADDRPSHLRLRAWERNAAATRIAAGGHRLRRETPGRGGVSERISRIALVGDLVPLRVINRGAENSNLCENPHERVGRVTAVTEHAILVEDTLNPIPLSTADVQRIASEYEELVHPVAVENFGEPTDIDGNGHVYIFMTSALNEHASRSGGGITVGFTFALDLLPRVGEGGLGCDASNEAEIFYIIAPDPQGVIGIEVPEELVRRLTTAIVVHELQHMINSGRRFYEVEDAREFEELWLNEGLSHIAEELVFYAATGLRPRTDIDWERVTAAEQVVSAYSRFVRDNLAIYSSYLEEPEDESLMGKSPSDDDFTTRGATWAFLRYLADQTPGEDAELFHALVNSPIGGLENLQRVLETDALTWMQRWTVSNYTDNLPPQQGVDARFTQPSWDFRSIFEGEIGTVPLTPRALQPEDSLRVALRGGGSAYLLLGAKAGHHARLTTARSGAPVFGEFRASVIRIE